MTFSRCRERTYIHNSWFQMQIFLICCVRLTFSSWYSSFSHKNTSKWTIISKIIFANLIIINFLKFSEFLLLIRGYFWETKSLIMYNFLYTFFSNSNIFRVIFTYTLGFSKIYLKLVFTKKKLGLYHLWSPKILFKRNTTFLQIDHYIITISHKKYFLETL